MISFSWFGFVAFVLGNPETQTVSRSFPKLCAPLQKKLRDRNRSRYQPGLKALLRVRLIDVGAAKPVTRLSRLAVRGAALRNSAYLSLKVAEPTFTPSIMISTRYVPVPSALELRL
jgi:hypothetical protein